MPGELEPLVIDAEIVEEPLVRDPVPIDLDEVIDAEGVEPRSWDDWRSPLDPDSFGYPTRLRGGVVTSHAGIEAINRSVDYALMPWWQRLVRRRPAGYSTPLADRWEL